MISCGFTFKLASSISERFIYVHAEWLSHDPGIMWLLTLREGNSKNQVFAYSFVFRHEY